MSRQRPGKPNDALREPAWREEWVALGDIVMHQPLQVRARLDVQAVKRYRAMTMAGRVPPPIRLGLRGGVYYLVDGWHRIEADAL